MEKESKRVKKNGDNFKIKGKTDEERLRLYRIDVVELLTYFYWYEIVDTRNEYLKLFSRGMNWLLGRTQEQLYARMTSEEKVTKILSLPTSILHKLLMKVSKSDLLDVSQRHFKKGVRFIGIGKEVLVYSMVSYFFGREIDELRRKNERVNMEDKKRYCHLTLCNIELPQDIIIEIFSYFTYDLDLLTSVGSLSTDFYLSILSTWPSVSISKRNIWSISLLVLHSVKKITFCDRLVKRDMIHILTELNETRRVREVRFSPPISTFGIKNWLNCANTFVRKKKKKKTKTKTKDHNPFQNVQRLIFPHPSTFSKKDYLYGTLQSTFRNATLYLIFPSLRFVEEPLHLPMLKRIRHLQSISLTHTVVYGNTYQTRLAYQLIPSFHSICLESYSKTITRLRITNFTGYFELGYLIKPLKSLRCLTIEIDEIPCDHVVSDLRTCLPLSLIEFHLLWSKLMDWKVPTRPPKKNSFLSNQDLPEFDENGLVYQDRKKEVQRRMGIMKFPSSSKKHQYHLKNLEVFEMKRFVLRKKVVPRLSYWKNLRVIDLYLYYFQKTRYFHYRPEYISEWFCKIIEDVSELVSLNSSLSFCRVFLKKRYSWYPQEKKEQNGVLFQYRNNELIVERIDCWEKNSNILHSGMEWIMSSSKRHNARRHGENKYPRQLNNYSFQVFYDLFYRRVVSNFLRNYKFQVFQEENNDHFLNHKLILMVRNRGLPGLEDEKNRKLEKLVRKVMLKDLNIKMIDWKVRNDDENVNKEEKFMEQFLKKKKKKKEYFSEEGDNNNIEHEDDDVSLFLCSRII